ncbi:MAG: DNA methyltransferase [Prolixibacteraceae bacterium]|nr:DNA methyltransferase [Prolixibacteraceae bacterium]
MERRKLTKADLDKVRDIEGFPIAKDEDIIALSDAPYYAACPNPFIEEFIREKGIPYDEATDDYHREPFAADVSVGKNDPTYLAHSYHTKVPYKAIMRYLMHYTKPGDLVLDGFCGTGMTGLAALMCGNPDVETKVAIEQAIGNVEWGKRFAILNDLSPAATFISANYNSPVDKMVFHREAEKILEATRKECAWLYKTKHVNKEDTISFSFNDEYGDINYVIWSDVYICPHCGEDIVFWKSAVDESTGEVKEVFSCPHCGAKAKKKDCSHAKEVIIDPITGDVREVSKQIPVQICYSYYGKKYLKEPDESDLELLTKINNYNIDCWYPTDELPLGDNTAQPRQSHGVAYAYDFLYKRPLIVFATLRKYCPTARYYWLITSILEGSSKLNRERPNGLPSKLNGTLYISSMVREINVLDFFERKIKRYLEANLVNDSNIVSTGSCTDLRNVPSNSIDYIFTDPPFGSNINYSELSFAWEAWLGVKTNNKEEAIINNTQKKQLSDYQELMEKCFCEYYRVLKPNRWMTVEFHNSKNSVWNAIQEALLKAGFIIADVRTLDKKQGSFKQVTTSTAVKQDLVISAYKPKESFKRKLIEEAGSPETAWEFTKQHLENIPVVVVKNNKIELLSERQALLLFDRMVAYHIVNGIPVPIDASDYYKGLDDRYLKRDGMYFLPDQVNEYDTARIVNDVEPIQFSFIVSNEKTAIAWLYQQLDTPQTYAEIQPKFMQEIKTVDKFEAMPELAVLLEENFLQDDKGRWYVPDVTKEADVAKLREKNLLKEFEGYLATKGKLKLFRAEAIRVGFAKLWKDKNYKLIVETAERLPEQIIQEDDKLLMYYDISLGRV